jgi:hypothetical protein
MIAAVEPKQLEASIAVTERRIAELNDRIIADLLKGRDPVEAEDQAVELRIALHQMKSATDTGAKAELRLKSPDELSRPASCVRSVSSSARLRKQDQLAKGPSASG